MNVIGKIVNMVVLAGYIIHIHKMVSFTCRVEEGSPGVLFSISRMEIKLQKPKATWFETVHANSPEYCLQWKVLCLLINCTDNVNFACGLCLPPYFASLYYSLASLLFQCLLNWVMCVLALIWSNTGINRNVLGTN